ncbi:MAG: family 16 glycoside hydrolase [Phycisphaerales bacterium JB054]
MHRSACSLSAAAAAAMLVGSCSAQGVGYTDTPKLPGQPWRVHDADRPNPPVVDPGPAPAAPAPVPSDAVVLFDGSGLEAWRSGDGSDAKWKLVDGGAMQVNGTGDIMTREEFGSCQLHVEWASPAEVVGSSQGRGNSGVFFFGRYEIQVLDSFNNRSYADGQAASLYGQFPPDVNACRGPGEWQTYDIVFEAPVFADDGSVVSPAYATVLHNGVIVHNRRALIGATGHRSVGTYSAHGPKGEIKLQDHGNPVRFRNIWVRPLAEPEHEMHHDEHGEHGEHDDHEGHEH